MRSLFARLLVLLFFGVVPGSACSAPAPQCSASTCAGCCDVAGVCQPGGESSACGGRGGLCAACGAGQVCLSNACQSTGLGGGAGGGGGGVDSGVGGGGGGTPDAGPGDGGVDAGADAGVPSTLTGHCFRRGLLQDGGIDVRPWNLGALTIGAWVTADGGTVFRPGSGTAAGTFSVPDVPPGRYMLQFGTYFIVADSRVLNFDFEAYGRSDAVRATVDPTPLAVALANLDPWQSDSELTLYSPNAGAKLEGFQRYASSQPTLGVDGYTATLNYYLYSWNLGTPLVQASRGDTAWLVQHRTDTLSNNVVFSISRSLDVLALEMADGQSAAISGAMTTPAPDSLTWDYRAAEFADAGTQLNAPASGEPPSLTLRMRASPRPATQTHHAFASLVELYVAEPDVPLATIAFSNPYPSGWDSVAELTYDVWVARQLGTSMPGWYAAGLSSRLSRAAFTSQPVRPGLGPVVQAKVNGGDLLLDQSGIGLTPTFTWQPPAFGTPTRYALNIDRLTVQGGATRVAQSYYVDTPETRVTLPPGILIAGQPYVVRLLVYSTSSQVDPNFYDQALPWHGATIISGILRP